MNPFEFIALLNAISYMNQPTTFLLELFFKLVPPHPTKTVMVDIERGGESMAVFVSPLHEGHVVKKNGYITDTFEPAYIKEKIPFTPDDLLVRQPGEVLFAPNQDQSDRLNLLVAKNLLILMKRIIRREEWMASQALTLGQMNVVGDGINRNINFNMLPTHLPVLAGNSIWTDLVNADPQANLSTWIDLILDDSGLNADKVVMGSAAIRSFLNHPKIKEVLNNRRMNIGDITPQLKNNGAQKIADWYDPNCEIWTYSGKYIDPATGNRMNLLPPNAVLIGSSAARCERHFAVIQDLKAKVNAALQFFPKTWETEDPSALWLMLQSAPLPIPHQIDGFVCATVQP